MSSLGLGNLKANYVPFKNSLNINMLPKYLKIILTKMYY